MLIKHVEEAIPQQLAITDHALRKTLAYARLVAQECGGSECIGYLLAGRERGDWLVDDVLLAPQQRATPASVKLEGSAVLTAGREIQRMGKRAVGWWHSHSDMAPFHSCIDEENTQKLLHELAPANLHYAQAAMPLTLLPAAEGLQLRSGARALGTLQGDPQSAIFNPQSAIEGATLQRLVPVGVVFSLVVNTRGQTYAEVATKQWCGFCQREEVKAQRVSLRLIPINEAPALDVAALRAEVRRKVCVPFVRWMPSARRRSDEEEARWRRLVSDSDEIGDESPAPSGADERNEGAPSPTTPTDAHPPQGDPSGPQLPASLVAMLEDLLTEVRTLKSLIGAMAQQAKEPSS